MQGFTEKTTQWTDIDFSTVIEGETPYIGRYDNKPYPALEKYRVNGIYGIKNLLLIYGTDDISALVGDKMLEYDKYEQAYIFRSTDNGKSFEKACLGHGTISYVTGTPIFANNLLYIQVDEQDTQKVRYYRSEDMGKTWISNDWKPTSVWRDGTIFIENEENKSATISQDHSKTWHPLSGTLKEFYDKTQSLLQLNENTLVGMTDNKEFLFLDLKTMKIEKKIFETPENKKIVGFAISNHQLGLELEEYALNDGRDIQTSYYFPETKEYVNLPKQLPYHVYWDVKDNYIGGIMHYGDDVFGTIVHVYTLDRGKHWSYEILDKYNLMTASAYIDGQFWFVASKDSAGGVFLTKGKIE
ncbi:MAG: hypothetical protein V2A75_05525 [Pseudomonadota bacterium]